MTPAAIASRNVKNEWDWAIANETRLLLVMWEPCKVPVNYVSINRIDVQSDENAAFDHIPQFAYVARPRISSQGVDRLVCKPLVNGALEVTRLQEMVGERINIFDAFTKRRNMDDKI